MPDLKNLITDSQFPLVALGDEVMKCFMYWDLCNVYVESS